MKSDKDYSLLLAQYNLAITRTKDLTERLKTKEEQWQKREDDFQVTKKLMKEFCEMILAKSPEYNQLGKENTFDSMSMNDMIRASVKAYNQYNKERTDLMNKVANAYEEITAHNIELEEEIKYYKNNYRIKTGDQEFESSDDDSSDVTESEAATNNPNPAEETSVNTSNSTSENQPKQPNKENRFSNLFKKKDVKSNTAKMSPNMQQAEKKGKITVEQAKEFKEALRDGTAVVQYEEIDEEVVEGDKTEKLHEENMRNNFTMKITPHSLPVKHTNNYNIKKQKKKEEIKYEVFGPQLQEMSERMSDHMWTILKVMGETGYSVASDIAGACVDEFMKKGMNMSARNIYARLSDLNVLKVLNKYSIVTPLKAKMTIYNFSYEGSMLHKQKFGNEPILSECDKLYAEHSSLEHGYGIFQCSQVIEKLEFDKKLIFKEVNIWNRKNPIKVGNAEGESHIKYIPDIICIDNNNAKMYIEYELNHHTKSDLNAKCNKMLMIGMDKINFIVPNTETAEAICKRLLEWIKSKGSSEIIRHISVRVTTAKSLEGHDIRRNNEWMFVLRPGKDKVFVKNF